ncbi:MAG TPA: hypothetical protein VJ901_18040 [Thermoanaerobaculia bacterium]|nr:hypothetical protein [Thermoanaerobaculia bacterium]
MAAALRADESLPPFGAATCDAHTSACGHRDREILTGVAAELRHVAREGVRLLIAQRDRSMRWSSARAARTAASDYRNVITGVALTFSV